MTLFILMFGACCLAPESAERGPPHQVLVLTTDAPKGVHLLLPSLQGLREWPLRGIRGHRRPDLATLLTGKRPAVHGVVEPVAHGLAVPLPSTLALERGGVDDWGFAVESTVTWTPVDRLDERVSSWRRTHPHDEVVVVGWQAKSVVWSGHPPNWPAGPVELVDVGRAIRAIQQGRSIPDPLPPVLPTTAPVFDRVVPGSIRRSGTRLDHDVFAPELAHREEKRLLRIADALDHRRLREAQERLDALREPESPEAVGLRADLLFLRGRPFDAMAQLEDRYECSPSALWAFDLAERWQDLRQPERARGWYLRVLTLHPDQPHAQLALWRYDGDPGRLAWLIVNAPKLADQALVEERMGQGEPVGDVDSPILQAQIRWSRGCTVCALEEVEAALVAEPRRIRLRELAARWSLEMGEASRAERLLAPVVRWLPNDAALSELMQQAFEQQAARRAADAALRREWRLHR